jgi:hypothetical protein
VGYIGVLAGSSIYFEEDDDEEEFDLLCRVSLRSCLRWAPATLPADKGFPTSECALSCDTDKSFSADHLSEMGAAERTAAPRTVAPIISNFRIVVSPINDKGHWKV